MCLSSRGWFGGEMISHDIVNIAVHMHNKFKVRNLLFWDLENLHCIISFNGQA